MNVNPGASFEAVAKFPTGLAGTLGVRIRDNEGADALARTTAGIVEDIAGSGIYCVTLIAPETGGQYTLVWDDAADNYAIEELRVVYSAIESSTPSGTDLCTLADVISYVPAYRANDVTDAKLADLVTSESDLIAAESGREIIASGAQPETRPFTISLNAARTQVVSIGDLASAGDTDITVELVSTSDAVVAATIDRAKYRAIYDTRRFQKSAWEPITALEFPLALGAPHFCVGQTLLVTGNWGFPVIPSFIVQACAKRVILRYITEVAGSGDSFSEAAAGLNLAGLFASARDAVDRISGPLA